MEGRAQLRQFLAVLFLVVAFAPSGNGADTKDDAAAVVSGITRLCESKGMLACESQIRGIPELFDFIRLLDQIDVLDRRFGAFVQDRYKEDVFHFEVLKASLSLKLDINYNPGRFMQKATAVNKVPGGYDVLTDTGETVKVRRVNEAWQLQIPETMAKQLEQLRPYILVGGLKRSILVFRMLEADMAKLTKAELEANVSKDLAPVLVMLFGKDKFPKLAQWLIKEPKDVIAFYSQFQTVGDMRAHIVKAHGL